MLYSSCETSFIQLQLEGIPTRVPLVSRGLRIFTKGNIYKIIFIIH